MSKMRGNKEGRRRFYTTKGNKRESEGLVRDYLELA